eukprot:m.72295 g.72295  ORF g.72295 m.72295 type:complete len:50 (-) comp14247_c0_seq9:231-380(-)
MLKVLYASQSSQWQVNRGVVVCLRLVVCSLGVVAEMLNVMSALVPLHGC